MMVTDMRNSENTKDEFIHIAMQDVYDIKVARFLFEESNRDKYDDNT